MNRKVPLIAGNWKMNKGIQETREFVQQLLERLSSPLPAEVAIFPPFTSIPAVAEILKNHHITYGAQNIYWELSGAFTGEISPKFLVELGCRYCLIGHSERRLMFGETDETCNRKVKSALNHNLRPILCCGETLTERENDDTIKVIRRQLERGLRGITSPELDIAYEPVWAIGTGHTATPEQAQEIHYWIRLWLKERFPHNDNSIRTLYGGSVKSKNAASLLNQPDVQGLLVGGASLDIDEFVLIVNSCQNKESKPTS